MRSSSEVRWVRARNNVGQATKVSDWHAIVPGFAKGGPPPGAACGTALSGSLQFESDEGVKRKDGSLHGECYSIAANWIAGLDQGPGPAEVEVDEPPLATPKNKRTRGRRAPVVLT